MKSNAPWSVKGIERDARETAKEAAKKEGLTVGEWLNQMIYSAGEAAPSDGVVEGLKLRDIITAIEHLHKRVTDSHTQQTDSLGDVTRKIGDVVERVQRLERVKPHQGGIDELVTRIEKLEANRGDRERIDALKALEKAVAQVAVQFNTAQKTTIQRLDSTERQLQEFAERLDRAGAGDSDISEIEFLKDAIDGLSTRLGQTERAARAAAAMTEEAGVSTDPEFVQNTGNRLRILGDEIKRSGDQIRTLEGTIEKLSHQVDAAERRSAEGVQKVTDTIADLRDSIAREASREHNRADIDAAISAASRDTDSRIEKLQNAFEEMINRLEALDAPEKAEIDADEPAIHSSATSQHAQKSGEDAAEVDSDSEPDVTSEQRAQSAHKDKDEDLYADEEDDNIGDPFAFTDEFDAVLEDITDSDDENPAHSDDEFSFELDDVAPAPVDEPSDTRASALLSEVKQLFVTKKVEDEEPSPDPDKAHYEDSDKTEERAFTPAQDEPDLDQILANLDQTDDSAAQSPTLEDSDPSDALSSSAETEEKPPLFGGKKTLSPLPESEANAAASAAGDRDDFLKVARQRAKDAAARAAEDAKSGRRKLTPKQKAILVARARKKRLAEARGESAPNTIDAKSAAAVKDALQSAPTGPSPDIDDAQDEPAADRSLFANALSGIRGNLPFLKGRRREEDAQDEDDFDNDRRAASPASAPTAARPDEELTSARNKDRAAFDSIKATASTRPVTIALAAGIVLSLAMLIYLMKDFVFRGDDAPEQVASSSTSQTIAEPSSDSASATAETPLEVPAPPAIDPVALYQDAMAGLSAAETESETAAAISKLQESAALGHPPAQLQLGEFYKTGQGVDQDLNRARTWFRRAANGGNVLAMHRIGIMTARGEGGPANAAEAINWFESAGNRGLVDSQYNLGAIYHPTAEQDAGGIQDARKAYYWYSLAAKNGDSQAAPLAAGLANALTAEEVSEIDAAIAAWEPTPADEIANQITPAG